MRSGNPASGRSLTMLVLAGMAILAAFPAAQRVLSQDLPAGAAQAPPAHPAPASDPGIPTERSPVQGGPPPDLVFFYSGEVMGYTDPCG